MAIKFNFSLQRDSNKADDKMALAGKAVSLFSLE